MNQHEPPTNRADPAGTPLGCCLPPHIQRLQFLKTDGTNKSARTFRFDDIDIQRHRITRTQYDDAIAAGGTTEANADYLASHGFTFQKEASLYQGLLERHKFRTAGSI